MSKKDANQSVNISLNNGKKNIKDRQMFTNLKKLQEQVFAEDCKGFNVIFTWLTVDIK